MLFRSNVKPGHLATLSDHQEVSAEVINVQGMNLLDLATYPDHQEVLSEENDMQYADAYNLVTFPAVEEPLTVGHNPNHTGT